MLTEVDVHRVVSTPHGRRHYFFCKTCGIECCSSTTFLKTRTGYCHVCIQPHLSKNRKRPYEWLYNKLLYTANSRDLQCDITYEQFLLFTEVACCRYCNEGVQWPAYSGKGRRSGCNLDRIDNTKGYTFTNVAVCCASCNTEKADRYSGDEFQLLKDMMRIYRQLDSVERKELELVILSFAHPKELFRATCPQA